METVASPTNPPPAHRLRSLLVNVATAAWRVLANPFLLLALSVVALGLVLIGLLVPQMPDQFNMDPAAVARWKLGVVSAYGALAGPLEVFGAFMGGGALLIVGVMGLTTPPEDAGLMHWLSSIGFVAVLGPLVLWGAVRLLRQTRGDST